MTTENTIDSMTYTAKPTDPTKTWTMDKTAQHRGTHAATPTTTVTSDVTITMATAVGKNIGRIMTMVLMTTVSSIMTLAVET